MVIKLYRLLLVIMGCFICSIIRTSDNQNRKDFLNYLEPIDIVDDEKSEINIKKFFSIEENPDNYNNKNIKILLLSSTYNGMTQKIDRNLKLKGYRNIYFQDFSNKVTEDFLKKIIFTFNPNLIICPYLLRRIPEEIFKNFITLVIHPGIKGDRGPSSLDWTILNGHEEWGVTIIQANEIMDGGDIWASENFKIGINYNHTNKSGLYNSLVAKTAVKLILESMEKFKNKTFVPEPLDYSNKDVKGYPQETIKPSNPNRNIDWSNDTTDIILRKINAADTQPGVKADLYFYNNQITRFLHGASRESYLKPGNEIKPGEIFAKRCEAVCIKTQDGAVWIRQMRNPKIESNLNPFKAPSVLNLERYLEKEAEAKNIKISQILPESEPKALDKPDALNTFQEISFEKINDSVGVINFDFYNGAMTKYQCKRLAESITLIAQDAQLKILILAGNRFNWSNGINLNVIEFAKDQKAEAMENLLAINNIIKEIFKMKNKIVISAVQANAGAGGVYLALASDYVFAYENITFNPHYKKMGLYGSEIHTFLGKRRVGKKMLEIIKEYAQPIIMKEAIKIGFVDDIDESLLKLEQVKNSTIEKNEYKEIQKKTLNLINSQDDFLEKVKFFAIHIDSYVDFNLILLNKNEKFNQDLNGKTIEEYEAEELKEMNEDIFKNRHSFAEKRNAFVLKL